MSEIITIQVGQCGNQIGSVFWPLALKEHGFGNENKIHQKKSIASNSLHSFFYCPSKISEYSTINDLKRGNVKARCILIDMEENVVDRYKRSALRDLFDSKCLLTNHPGSGNNWAVGHYEHGRDQLKTILEMIRRSAESSDFLHGFKLLFSLGGGTGSGLGSAILPLLEDNFPNVDRLVTCIHPGVYNDVITSPYNIALSLRQLTEHASCVFPVDNKALIDICNKFNKTKERITAHPYRDMNSLIVKMLLHLTSGSRFPGPLNVDLNELAMNMTPFPGLHYLTSSFSPLDTPILKHSELLTSVCSRSSQLLRVDPLSGTVLAATLLCRGDISLSSSRDFVDRFLKKSKLVPWNKNGVKTGLCSVPPADAPRSLLCLTNSTSVSTLFSETVEHFDKLYKRKAHTHHYLKIDGFEAQDFDLARNSLMETLDKYVFACKKVEIPRIKLV
ncbi:hypothetical protein LSTR_LSTR000225 [Laodelphax striatellus]|uniref:Tubulin/FtsZ GTPase domain-containing protein n=2 Tax=Laodelphax striatellus TaxID=195883 RepID=A0A482X864_LAOST|nr:hypothetical protein LSTR_LSTR000225 [Laodelphax striatellus]